ncbi:ribonuclease domain-containing protein [Corynebacterium wankanglinii]|uniref:Guanyl-specific ribonuclease n=1 Tax=Corynebacterium wankanglinii TaxID=2735136 RepID=A0A838CJZ1_9CORY|nr:ribonuclease domain-containing protein [Corynebacterium wankanglinii]MBA1835257.1 guanyl-specific ribonuclease [Corynebacterium wankanglinii]
MKRPFVLLACFFLSSCLSTPPSAPPPTSSLPASGLPACDELPGEAWDTVDLIEAGGPFPYPANDDRRFGNYERALPQQPTNYYREYTVDTPGVGHRGARRIVTGGGADGHVDEWFYTADHYNTFCEMEVN